MKGLRLVTVLSAFGLLAGATMAADDLTEHFAAPPDSARPWVYWFPLDGNITSNGITLDLEAMKRAGIGGVLYMETDQGAPPGPAKFAGPLWRDLFKHICAEADRLGLKVNMNNDAGWCGSGGPWITPELSMQRVVWSETNLTGPQHFDAVLKQPNSVKDYHRDIAVFAFPTPGKSYSIGRLSGKSAATKEEIPLRAYFPALPAESVTPKEKVVNLTTRCGQDGRLAWDVPAGEWTILRLGHTTTGKDNHPAPIDGRGLECDKLSSVAAEVMFDGLMGKLIADNRRFVGEKNTLVSTHIDSWEVGSQNWTPKFREEFKRLRGYDPLPFLPVFAGHVVDSLEISERFLWDVRMTVNDLLLENYAGHFRAMAHRHGMRLSIEAYDGVPADDMAYAGRSDEPMGEFWSYQAYSGSQWCTEMASAAHVYGRPILGAEAFTATDAEKWQGHPGSIKAMGDWAFCEGINRFVFHRYALQPWTDARPGMSMGPWGLHYERTQTWWEQSRAWHDYLARCQFLLQQGLFVADLCFLAPETSPQCFKSPVKSSHDRPGYNFDGCPPEVVLTRMKARDGRLVLPDGMSYRMLVLPQAPTMTPQLLRKIRDLVKDGATVVGAPPVKSPSLSGYPQCDDEVKQLAAEVWGQSAPSASTAATSPGEMAYTERPFGKGRVIWGGGFRPYPTATSAESVDPLLGAKWIWFKEGNPVQSAPPAKRFFRKLVTVDGAVQSARITMTADNGFECWVNGKHVGSGDNFKVSYDLDVTSALKSGVNLITVAAVNTTDRPSPAGLIGMLAINYRNGRSQEIPTDGTWQAATSAPDGWTADAAATAQWTAAMELGPLGMGPWGDIAPALASTDPTPDINILCRLLAKMGVPPDFNASTPGAQAFTGLRHIHKRIGETDVYFVANKDPQAAEAVCAFRVAGKRPELWWPDTGRTERVAAYNEADGVTRLPVRLDPSGSVFVVFRKARPEADRVVAVMRNGQTVLDLLGKSGQAQTTSIELARDGKGALQATVSQPGSYVLKTANGKTRALDVAAVPAPLEITGPWEVRFDPKWGGPASAVTFAKLEDWSKRPEPGIRYYSGTAVYRKTFSLNGPRSPRDRLWLDLGQVAVMAEVNVNGRDLGILWKPPFRVDVTDALKPGENALELKVVNLWINRQIGDQQLPEDSDRNPNGTLKSWPQWVQEGKFSPTGRYTFTSWRLWKKDDPLVESGLIGPVTLLTQVSTVAK